jgi:hypothetical protein
MATIAPFFSYRFAHSLREIVGEIVGEIVEGFVMDQATLIVVQAFMVATLSSRAVTIWSHITILAIMLANLAGPLTIRFAAEPFEHVWWISYQIALMVVFTAFRLYLPNIGAQTAR